MIKAFIRRIAREEITKAEAAKAPRIYVVGAASMRGAELWVPIAERQDDRRPR